MKRCWKGAVLVCLLFFGLATEAFAISKMYGGANGFGFNMVAGSSFTPDVAFQRELNHRKNQNPADKFGITDAFGHGFEDQNKQYAWRQWTMSLTSEEIRDLDQMAIASISLQMLTGSKQWFYQGSTLYYDDAPGDFENWVALGGFSPTKSLRTYRLQDAHYVREDVFDLLPFQESILTCLRASGLTFKLQTSADPSSESFPFVGWMMDYSCLTVSGDKTVIPETHTLWLLAGGLLTLLAIRRWRAI